jgi:hypothetical protein
MITYENAEWLYICGFHETLIIKTGQKDFKFIRYSVALIAYDNNFKIEIKSIWNNV